MLNADDRQIRDLARDFARGEVAGQAAAWDAQAAIDPAVVAQLNELAMLRPTWAEAAGGAGLSHLALTLIIEELARHSGVLGYLLAQQALVGEAVALGLAPPEPLSVGVAPLAPSQPSLSVERVRFGRGASLVLCPLRAPDRSGLRLVAVESGELVASDPPLGLRGVGFATLSEPPRAALSGDLALGDEGWRRLRTVAWLGAAAVGVGLARAALEEGARYAGERKQFGRPIAAFQAIAFKLADMACECDAARLMVHAAADQLDRGGRGHRAAAMAKLMACEAAMAATDEALQIHGGYGYTKDFPVERFWRDAKALRVLDGSPDALRRSAASGPERPFG